MSERDDQQPVGTSTRVRDQPSLTTSSGKSWLILAGLLAAIAVGVLIPLLPLQPAGLALVGMCVIVALYAAMIVVRVNVRSSKLMLGLLAALMIGIAVMGLISVGIIAGTTGNITL